MLLGNESASANALAGQGKEKSEINEKIISSLYVKEKSPFLEDEKVLLKRLLENYKMPVTHLINFLNFGKVGPEKFIEQNLLRFPQAMSPASIYGTAIHEAMQNYYLYKKKYEKNPDLDRVVGFFRNALNKGALNKLDYQKYYEAGSKNLDIYVAHLESKKEEGKIEVEVNFANEGVQIGPVAVTGKIDKIIIHGNTLEVVDLKTGKSFKDWDSGESNYDKIKIHFFKYQLAYYYLLLKKSRSYEKFSFDGGGIEFIEADSKNKINTLKLEMNEEFLEIVERVEKLTEIVYTKIMNLDFPNTEHYKISEKTGEEKSEITLKDILKFEEDLINGNI